MFTSDEPEFSGNEPFFGSDAQPDSPPQFYGPAEEVPDDYVAPQGELQPFGSGASDSSASEGAIADQILNDVINNILRGN